MGCHTNNPKIRIDDTIDIVEPKKYIVYKIIDKINIDGRGEEEVWKKAKFTESFIDIEGVKIPKYETKAKMLWDDTYFYVYALLKEEHIWATLKQRDTVIFYNNDFEIFIDPSNNGLNYAEIEINALGTVWDLKLNKPYNFSGKADNNWDIKELKSAVYINGTLNNSFDVDKYWSVEMAIPIKTILDLTDNHQNKVKENDQWRVNFSRVQWDFDMDNGRYKRKKVDGKIQPEHNWVWSNQNRINMHLPERWAYIQFSEKDQNTPINFINDEYKVQKQLTFFVLRKILNGDLNYLKNKKEGFTTDFETISLGKEAYDLNFEKNKEGFKLTVKNLETKKVLKINQDGKQI